MTMQMEVEEHHQHRCHNSSQLVYEPQSNATPSANLTLTLSEGNNDASMTEAAAATTPSAAASEAAESAAAAAAAAVGRRRKRRSLFGSAKHSPVPLKSAKRKSTVGAGDGGGGSDRRACLTEILWEDVQKAKELLGFRQKADQPTTATTSTTASSAQPTQPHQLMQQQQHPVIARIVGGGGPNHRPHHGPLRHHHRPGLAPMAISEEAENALPRSTVSLPRPHKHRRASSDLASSSIVMASIAASSDEATADTTASVSSATSYRCQLHQLHQHPSPDDAAATPKPRPPSSPEHQRRVARFWELKRLIAELGERRAAKARQLAVLEAEEKSLSSSGDYFHHHQQAQSGQHYHHHSHPELSHHGLQQQQPQLHRQSSADCQPQQQLCFPTQYLVAVEDFAQQSELLQLQEEAAVQRALVEANARLLRECQADRTARQLKRRRAQEFQRSQEKLRTLNQRIAEIRARDSAASAAATAASASSVGGHFAPDDDGNGEAAASESSASAAAAAAAAAATATTWSQSLPALRPHTIAAVSIGMSSLATTVSHSGSVDSGFQELLTVSTSSSGAAVTTASSSCYGFRPIDAEDDEIDEGGLSCYENE